MLKNEKTHHCNTLISDFSDIRFKTGFRQYFADLGIGVQDWDGLFEKMNAEGGNIAFVRTASNGETIGFVLFCPEMFSSGFFEETYGFVRELWVAKAFRAQGNGSELLLLAEKYFQENGIFTSILTAEDDAVHFYEKMGYARARGCKAKNKDDVFVKRLG